MFCSSSTWGMVALVVASFAPGPAANAGEAAGDVGSRKNAARDIVDGSRYCALVTIGEDGAPNVRMMDAFAPEDDFVVWMATNTLSRKVEDLRGNPRAAVYYADPSAPGYVTIRGVARLVDDPDEKRKRWKEEWSAFYREDHSNYVLIEVRPDTIEVVNYRTGVVSEVETWAAPVVVPAAKSAQD